MKPSEESITRLLASTYSRQPDPSYWQGFIKQYHHNQRLSALSSSPTSRFLSTLRIWISNAKPTKLAYVAGIAYASASIVFFLFPREAPQTPLPQTPIHHQIIHTPTPDSSPPPKENPKQTQPF